MPATSQAQQRLFGMALARKRGKPVGSPVVQNLAKSMSEDTLHDFAATKAKGLPKHASTLGKLRDAREASDQGSMVHKAVILSSMMRDRPEDWIVDSDPRDPYPGITHVPTGFRFHAPQRIIPPSILEPAMEQALARAQGLDKAATAKQVLARAAQLWHGGAKDAADVLVRRSNLFGGASYPRARQLFDRASKPVAQEAKAVKPKDGQQMLNL